MTDQLSPNQPSTARPLDIPPPAQPRRQLSHRTLVSLEKAAQDSDVYPLEGRATVDVAAHNSVGVTGGGNGGLNEASKSANVGGAGGGNAFSGEVGR